MGTNLQLGNSFGFEVDLPPEVAVTHCAAPRGKPLDDVGSKLAEVLEHPLEFPPLRRAVVPGDRVAIVAELGLPQEEKLCAQIAEVVMRAGVEPQDIVIMEDKDARPPLDPRSQLDLQVAEKVQRVAHDPAYREGLSFLGATHEGEAVYLNRKVCDADVVIPIGIAGGKRSSSGALMPGMSDEAALKRFRDPVAGESADKRTRLRKEADEVSWLLGAHFTVQVVPGDDQEILHVLAGETAIVTAEAQRLGTEAWHFNVADRPEMVISSVGTSGEAATWNEFAAALSTAERLIEDDGAIVMSANMQLEPGPALTHLIDVVDLGAAMRSIRRSRSADTAAAAALARALDRCRVYLISDLEDELVESLGMTPIEPPGDIRRLASQFSSCLVLSNGNRASVDLNGHY